jgi:hypothetical protein
VSGNGDDLSLQSGTASWMVLIICIVGYRFFTKLPKEKKFYLIFFLSILIGSIFLTTDLSRIVWQLIPFRDYIQFPWRLLFFTTFATAAIAGFLLGHFNNKLRKVFAIIFIALMFVEIPLYFVVSPERKKDDSFYFTSPATTLNQNEIDSIWSKKSPDSYVFDKLQPNNDIELLNSTVKSNYYKFDVNVLNGTTAVVNTIYFPGWIVRVDGQSRAINYDNDLGIIQFPLTPGDSKVEVNFTETNIRIVSDLISMIGILSLVGLFVFRKKYDV